jgi:hypothetical protein
MATRLRTPARTSLPACIQTRMASEIVVGVYESRREAEAARAQLLAQGIGEHQIAIEERPAAEESDDHGPPGFIARMFSGALMDDESIATYNEALHSGRRLLVVRAESRTQSQVATTVLARTGPRIYSLPNAPSAWSEATAGDPASIGGVDRDPARPEGLLEDAEGLSAQGDVTRLSNSPRVRRNR